ncbi:MAG: hypothetical protein NTX50_29245, partial [Candidatus Sumerlaeota bacterium]|nr:hypothetical protein [Candidatus Sumerlaeota bacterium]
AVRRPQVQGPSILFPAPTASSYPAELDALTSRILALNSPMRLPYAEYLGEDWTTQGDSFGRIGRAKAIYCASSYAAPPKRVLSFNFMNSRAHLSDVIGNIGPNAPVNDSLRHWIHWSTTDNPRTLYIPSVGVRRQAEWDDHGEAYPRSHEGPDLWLLVKTTERVNRFSLYFFNKDGHQGENRCRDYQIKIYPHTEDLVTSGGEKRGPRTEWGGVTISSDLLTFDGKPALPTYKFDRLTGMPATALRGAPLAETRVRDFWGGVYKQFVLSGPAKYWVRIEKSTSLNSIVSGCFLDILAGPRPEWDEKGDLSNTAAIPYLPPAIPSSIPAANPCYSAFRLWNASENNYGVAGIGNLFVFARRYAWRAAENAAPQTPPPLLANMRWNLGVWGKDERIQFSMDMKTFWWAMQKLHPIFRQRDFRCISPNVYATAQEWETRHGNEYTLTYIMGKGGIYECKPNIK